jgi:uncharacterized membrane protein YeaQ/YmgE (transglycosylase-associated protein family)
VLSRVRTPQACSDERDLVSVRWRDCRLTGLFVNGGGLGLISDLVVGIIGALIGGLLVGGSFLGGALLGSIVVATLGAVILLVVLRVIQKA